MINPPKMLDAAAFAALEADLPVAKKTQAKQLYNRIDAGFVLPPNIAAWKTATDVGGHFFGTKSRGATLVKVDRAYQDWIEDDITDGGNAENLVSALREYTGISVHNLGALSTNYRSERNKNNVMGNTLKLADLLRVIYQESPLSLEGRRISTRTAMLGLLANIKIDWDYKKTLLVGIAGSALGAAELIDPDLTKNIANSLQAGANTLGEVGSGAVSFGATVAVGGIAALAVDDLPGKLKNLIVEQWNSFMRWVKQTFTKSFGAKEATELVGLAGKALAPILQVVASQLKLVANVAAGASDIYDGVRGMIVDAWTRHTLTVATEQLGTLDGSFMMITKGIHVGIRNRQAVSAWKIVKGTVKTTVSVLSTPVAGKIADLVLGAFEFIFKMLYNLREISRIGDFCAKAKIMWNKVVNMPADAAPMTAPEIFYNDSEEPLSTGKMVAFNPDRYEAHHFLNDSKSAYTHFLYALVDASPVLAAVYLNGCGFHGAKDVFHSVTPRSKRDDERAVVLLKKFEIEAEQLFRESGYELKDNTMDIPEKYKADVELRVKGAKFLKPTLARQSNQGNLLSA